MNKNNYLKLCNSCDKILTSPMSTLERVAIPWLHVIREHPVFLQRYELLFLVNGNTPSLMKGIWTYIKKLLSIVKTLILSLMANGIPWHGQIHSRKIDILFISHLLSESQAGKSDDFYFGNLPVEYDAHYRPVLIALLNHSKVSGMKLARNWNNKHVSRVIFSRTLKIQDELYNLIRLIRESKSLNKMAKNKKDEYAERILNTASKEACSSESLGLLRLYTQVGNLVKKFNPRVIVITHEGHAWERITFAAARKVSPDIRCVGYQHAAIFKHQHAIRRNLAPQYNPDHIFTSGKIPNVLLEKSSGLAGISKSILGSIRYLKEDDKNNSTTKEMANTCLVIAEGITSECNQMLEFSLACAQLLPEIKFIWRFHPSTTFERLKKGNSKLLLLPNNIILSKNTLEVDILQSDWVLYRGSTAVVSAVVGKCRPVYLSNSDEMTIDPLYDLNNNWKIVINEVDEFCRIVNNKDEDTDGTTRDMMKSIAYCKQYYVPFDYHQLLHC